MSEIRLPYSDVIPELREKRTMFPGAPQKEFCAVKQGGYLKLAGMEMWAFCRPQVGPQFLRWSKIFKEQLVSETKRVWEKDQSPKLIPKRQH